MVDLPRDTVCWTILLVLLDILGFIACATGFTKFKANPNVTERNCGPEDEVFVLSVAGGLAECGGRCKSPACRSVFYTDDGSRRCQGCSQVYTPSSALTQAAGASYYGVDKCEPPWVSYGASCYYQPGLGQKRTFLDGWSFCQDHDGTLAYIDDGAENSFLTSYLQSSGGDNQNFIGFIRYASNVSAGFAYYGDGRPWAYSNWRDAFPNTDYPGVDQCAIIRKTDGIMRHDNCTIPKTPLCEKDASF